MTRRLSELYSAGSVGRTENGFLIPGNFSPESGNGAGGPSVNIVAMGDVGLTLAIGLRLKGAGIISRIGIFDLNEKLLQRCEAELNQITEHGPSGPEPMPPVGITDDPFDGDILMFCASRGVPPVSEKTTDVRLAQLEANRELVSSYARQALKREYRGHFFVVSDPVDDLCAAVAAEGFPCDRIRGFGLGVMYGRARYYAEDPRTFETYGRAYGPHGDDLVIADNIRHYDDEKSRKLTEETVRSNLRTRALGFKPYIAPALSSGALTLLSLLRGYWQYSSVSFGDAFLGCRNRLSPGGCEVEDPELDEKLFRRIEAARDHLARRASK